MNNNTSEQYSYVRSGVAFSMPVIKESDYSPAYNKLLHYEDILSRTTDKRKAAGIKGHITRLRKKITPAETQDYFLKSLESRMRGDASNCLSI